MRIHPLSAILIVLIAALAGCVGGDDDPETDDPGEQRNPGDERGVSFKPADATDLDEALEAIEIVDEDDPDWDRPNLTKEDWLFLSTPMSSEGSVAAFAWEFPKDAIVTDPRGSGLIVALDFAIALEPMGMADGLPEGTDWIVMAFYEREDDTEGWQTVLGGYEWGATMENVEWDAAGSPSAVTSAPPSDPFILRVGGGDRVGDNIYFVIAARGASGEFGVGVRVLPEASAGRDSSPSSDWSTFTDQVGTEENPPYVPTRVSETQGLYLGLYHESLTQGQGGVVTQLTQDMIEVSDTVPTDGAPLAGPRATELQSSVGFGGWSEVDIRYQNNPSGNVWTVEGSVNGHDANKQILITAPDTRTCMLTVEGDGGTSLTNTVENPATVQQESITFKHFSVNVKPESLSGYPLRSNQNC